jgi:hypothetical protein
MRTTVDLAPAVHARAGELAQQNHQSLSSVLADLVARGLEQVDGLTPITTSPVTGLPVMDVGGPFTAAQVAEMIDEDS